MPNKTKEIPNGIKKTNQPCVVEETTVELYRVPVVGFLITLYEMGIFQRPIITETDERNVGAEACNLDNGEKIVGVIPAPIGSYQVSKVDERGLLTVIGYEYPGADHPNWCDGEQNDENNGSPKL